LGEAKNGDRRDLTLLSLLKIEPNTYFLKYYHPSSPSIPKSNRPQGKIIVT